MLAFIQHLFRLKQKSRKRVAEMPKKKRNYRKEYDNYQGRPEQKKNRAHRNAARRKAIREGRAHKGDGKDVHHPTGDPRSKQTKVVSRSSNRSFPRNKNAGKKKKAS